MLNRPTNRLTICLTVGLTALARFAPYSLNIHVTQANRPTGENLYLCAGIVQHTKGGLVALDGGDVDDGTALGNVGHSCLSNAEVGQDIAVEGEFQPLPGDILKIVNILACKQQHEVAHS